MWAFVPVGMFPCALLSMWAIIGVGISRVSIYDSGHLSVRNLRVGFFHRTQWFGGGKYPPDYTASHSGWQCHLFLSIVMFLCHTVSNNRITTGKAVGGSSWDWFQGSFLPSICLKILRKSMNNSDMWYANQQHEGMFNPSAWRFKFRCCVSPAVLFSAHHLNSDWELLYSSLFLKYMRYKHETFTKMILKDGFISFIFNHIGTLYLSNGSGWNYRLPCTGRKTPEPYSCTRPCASKSLNSVNATIISNTLQNTACPYLIYFTCYVSAMFHSTLMLRVEAVGFMFHTLCMYRRAMERIVGMIYFFPPYRHKGWGKSALR
jgi:hypothetical protein